MTRDERIEGIKARLEKATPGEWQQSHRKVNEDNWSTQVYTQEGTICTLHWYPQPLGDGVTGTYREANAELIRNAPADLRFLLSRVEEQGWTRVAPETMPPENTSVLVCDSENNVNTDFWHNGGWGAPIIGKPRPRGYTYWRPLPQPPAQEGK